MSNKALDNYPNALEFLHEHYKTQAMCDKAVSTYPSTIKFVHECFMIQEMYDKAAYRCVFVFYSISDQ